MPTILIVDDRRDAIEVLQAKLQQNGFVTESTEDARDIMGICARQQIDVIIMDMNMPELDGCEATELLKADEATSKIPVIICTAQPIDGDKERAVQSGCDGFIEKAILLEKLTSVLGQFLDVDKEGSGEKTGQAGDGGLPTDAIKLGIHVSPPHAGVPRPNFNADNVTAANPEKNDKDLLPWPAE
jgi:two-component system, cell cycle response regulator DivK